MDSREKGKKNIFRVVFLCTRRKQQPRQPNDSRKINLKILWVVEKYFFIAPKSFYPVIWLLLSLLLLCLAPCSTKKQSLIYGLTCSRK
jgi:hypothetical protein